MSGGLEAWWRRLGGFDTRLGLTEQLKEQTAINGHLQAFFNWRPPISNAASWSMAVGHIQMIFNSAPGVERTVAS